MQKKTIIPNDEVFLRDKNKDLGHLKHNKLK